jgi:hypothetical protein
MKSFIFITLLSMSFNLFATNDFECTVKEVYKLNESGLLAPEKGSVTPDVSSKFIVNRQSGLIPCLAICPLSIAIYPQKTPIRH